MINAKASFCLACPRPSLHEDFTTSRAPPLMHGCCLCSLKTVTSTVTFQPFLCDSIFLSSSLLEVSIYSEYSPASRRTSAVRRSHPLYRRRPNSPPTDVLLVLVRQLLPPLPSLKHLVSPKVLVHSFQSGSHLLQGSPRIRHPPLVVPQAFEVARAWCRLLSR